MLSKRFGMEDLSSDDLEATRQELQHAGKTIQDFKTALDEHAIVAITDPTGKITYVNEKFCEISQYQNDELIGQDHRILNSGYHSKDFFKDLWTVIGSGKVWQGEIRNRRKDGAFYWVNTTIVPFLDEQGRPQQFIAIRADITEQKCNEERLRKITDELERKNKELEAVIYAASHDLRSPLVNVQGFASVISEQVDELRDLVLSGNGTSPTQAELDELGSEIKKSLGFVEAGAEKMDALLNGLLVISRVGRAIVHPRTLNVAQLVENNLAAMNYQIEQAEAEVVLGELPAAFADGNLFGQVLANLFGNALKYASPDRLPRLEMRGEEREGRVFYEIIDNGIGIAEAHQQRIFDLFHRLNPGDSEGHGIGLSIVARAMERMGGNVSVFSELGQGTTFQLQLPSKDQW